MRDFVLGNVNFMTEVEIGMSNIFDKYFEKQHTIHASKCVNCGKGMKAVNKKRRGKALNLCFTCVNDKDNLPEKFFCKGVSKSTGKRCKKLTLDDYCAQHKKQGESNGKD